jgi:hypothetical protein
MVKKIVMILPILLLISCTQLVDEEEPYTESYKGDDGCIICHTNKARLQALAPASDGDGPPDGG